MINRRALLGAAAALAFSARAAGGAQSSKLILLGTAGGPSPKPNRAASAQAIVIGDRIYVIDCGNGVARQLVLAGQKLDQLAHIFITHHHSDHNADYGNLLLLAWANNLATSVSSWGPPPLKRMTRQFLALNQTDIGIRIADEGRVDPAKLIKPNELRQAGLVMADDRVRVTAALVDHPPVVPSFAYRFDSADRSIVISGDCRPSPALVALAKGADVLVHEVMHLPSLEVLIASEPNAKTLREHLIASHTSTEQVGKLATEAGVRTLVLSHFVPGGYPFLSDSIWFDAVRPHFAGELIIGRDLMMI